MFSAIRTNFIHPWKVGGKKVFQDKDKIDLSTRTGFGSKNFALHPARR